MRGRLVAKPEVGCRGIQNSRTGFAELLKLERNFICANASVGLAKA